VLPASLGKRGRRALEELGKTYDRPRRDGWVHLDDVLERGPGSPDPNLAIMADRNVLIDLNVTSRASMKIIDGDSLLSNRSANVHLWTRKYFVLRIHSGTFYISAVAGCVADTGYPLCYGSLGILWLPDIRVLLQHILVALAADIGVHLAF